jgi:hypothetical protein
MVQVDSKDPKKACRKIWKNQRNIQTDFYWAQPEITSGVCFNEMP